MDTLWNLCYKGHIVEPHGHILLVYREVFSFKGKMYCHYTCIAGAAEVSFIQRCPLFRVSFIRAVYIQGDTAHTRRQSYSFCTRTHTTTQFELPYLQILRVKEFKFREVLGRRSLAEVDRNNERSVENLVQVMWTRPIPKIPLCTHNIPAVSDPDSKMGLTAPLSHLHPPSAPCPFPFPPPPPPPSALIFPSLSLSLSLPVPPLLHLPHCRMMMRSLIRGVARSGDDSRQRGRKEGEEEEEGITGERILQPHLLDGTLMAMKFHTAILNLGIYNRGSLVGPI